MTDSPYKKASLINSLKERALYQYLNLVDTGLSGPAKNADGEKSLKQIAQDIGADLYHGYLIYEKLVNKGCIVSPVKEVPLLEPV